MTDSDPLSVPATLRHHMLIGTGGIGTGRFFALDGNRTLGREESRGGRFLDRRDYCKLHIMTHYVATLMGPGFRTLPVGRVGNDDAGRRLVEEMRSTGIDTGYVSVAPGESTLSSVCFLYPDGTGGNLTASDSASAHVDAAALSAAVAAVDSECAASAGRGAALAAPEVPLEARDALLRLGTRHGLLRAASYVSEEVAHLLDGDIAEHIDLLALNSEEAGRLAGMDPSRGDEAVAAAAGRLLAERNAGLCLLVTGGRRGSWLFESGRLAHRAACRVELVNTAGAGDAHLAGMLSGLASGLTMLEALDLGVLLAGLSVTSPHTICPEAGRCALRELAGRQDWTPAPAVTALLSP
ncbi:carbohydrate kinase family protein [Verrucomicrobiota bacterium]